MMVIGVDGLSLSNWGFVSILETFGRGARASRKPAVEGELPGGGL